MQRAFLDLLPTAWGSEEPCWPDGVERQTQSFYKMIAEEKSATAATTVLGATVFAVLLLNALEYVVHQSIAATTESLVATLTRSAAASTSLRLHWSFGPAF